MKSICIYIANTILYICDCLLIAGLACEIILFFSGMRLDWLAELDSFYPDVLRIKNRAVSLNRDFNKLNGWCNSPGSRKSEEDPNVIETVWPNLMRACRNNPDKCTKLNVAFINGSNTFGQGVADHDTMVWLLNEKYHNVTFDNYAVPGYGPLQCLEHLKTNIFKNKHYDLICYNINYGNIFVNAFAHAQHGNLGVNQVYFIAPYSEKDIFGRWHNYNSFKHKYIFQNRLLCLDLAQRFYLARIKSYDYNISSIDPLEKSKFSYHRLIPTISLADLFKQPKSRMVYNHQIQEIEKLCCKQNCDFAVFSLEPSVNEAIFPNLDITGPKVDISFAEIDNPKYHVLQRKELHPNAIVHAHWAQRFSEWFDKEYLPKKSKP